MCFARGLESPRPDTCHESCQEVRRESPDPALLSAGHLAIFRALAFVFFSCGSLFAYLRLLFFFFVDGLDNTCPFEVMIIRQNVRMSRFTKKCDRIGVTN